jgi:hypothetical protein
MAIVLGEGGKGGHSWYNFNWTNLLYFNDIQSLVSRCTSDLPQLCQASAMAYLILPPALSGRHSSEKSFSFRYGVVEVTAKLPRGDWLVPGKQN